MTIELDYLKWLTSSISKFGKILNVPLDPIPSDVIDPILTFTSRSGIKITGELKPTRQPNRFLITPGTKLLFEGGTAGVIPFKGFAPTSWDIPGINSLLDYPGEIEIGPGKKVVIAKPKSIGPNDPTCLDEAILVEGFHTDLNILPLLSWPKVIQGVTEADVNDFLAQTPYWMEVQEGWQGRYAHPRLNMPSTAEPGYGGAIAEITSFGALLLCANISDELKLKVQDRFMYLVYYLDESDIDYPADGGHGNGRYIIALIALKLGISLPNHRYSELIQVYRRPDGTLDWRHNPTTISTKGDGSNAENYRTCCTANRWAGAAIAASLVPNLMANQDWITYTKAYLTENFDNPEAWKFCNHGRTAELLRLNRGVIGI